MISSTIENTFYSAKRSKVEAYVAGYTSRCTLGGGSALEGAFDSARIIDRQRNVAINNFINDYDYLFRNNQLVADHLSEVFFALCGIKRINKKINDLGRMKAHQIIMDYAAENFEDLRIAVEQGAGLDKLATRLNINEPAKRQLFNQQAKLLYKTIYLEPVIVGIMVHS